MSLRQRKRPAPPQNRPFPDNSIAAIHSNGHHRRQDGFVAPSVEDRDDTTVLAAAFERGYRIAVQCIDCGHWLINPVSVAAFRGPRCRAKGAV
jgi:hypothetical protein